MNISNIFKFGTIILLAQVVSSFASDYPQTKQEKIRENMGTLVGDEGITFRPFHAKNENTKTPSKGVHKVNQYLWDASRAILQNMPMINVDATHGIIVTDWYSDRNDPNYAYKIEVTIKDDVISPDAINVSLFERSLKNGQWYNNATTPARSVIFEDRIIRKARELYIENKKSH